MGSLNLFPRHHPGQPRLTHMGFWDPALTPLPQQRARCSGLDQGLVQPQQHHGATGGDCHPPCHCSRPQGKRSGAEMGCGSLPGSDRRFPPGSARLPQLCPVVGVALGLVSDKLGPVNCEYVVGPTPGPALPLVSPLLWLREDVVCSPPLPLLVRESVSCGLTPLSTGH